MTKRPPVPDEQALKALSHTLAELLDKVSVRAEAGYDVQQELGLLMEGWKAGGDRADGAGLIQRAQGRVGMVNASRERDPMRDLAYRQLTEFKNELRAFTRAD